ncbi:hypothetical protein DYB36_006708, partial [Aphanomyces astaci]
MYHHRSNLKMRIHTDAIANHKIIRNPTMSNDMSAAVLRQTLALVKANDGQFTAQHGEILLTIYTNEAEMALLQAASELVERQRVTCVTAAPSGRSFTRVSSHHGSSGGPSFYICFSHYCSFQVIFDDALRRLHGTPVPPMGGWCSFRLDPQHPLLTFHRPHTSTTRHEARQFILEYTSPRLFSKVSLDHLLVLLGCLCCEVKVLLKSSDPSLLTSCVLAVRALLDPFEWVKKAGVVVTLLPPSLGEILEAPVPFLVGQVTSKQHYCHHSTRSSVPSLVQLDIDTNTLIMDDQEAEVLHELKLPRSDSLQFQLQSYASTCFGSDLSPQSLERHHVEACEHMSACIQSHLASLLDPSQHQHDAPFLHRFHSTQMYSIASSESNLNDLEDVSGGAGSDLEGESTSYEPTAPCAGAMTRGRRVSMVEGLDLLTMDRLLSARLLYSAPLACQLCAVFFHVSPKKCCRLCGNFVCLDCAEKLLVHGQRWTRGGMVVVKGKDKRRGNESDNLEVISHTKGLRTLGGPSSGRFAADMRVRVGGYGRPDQTWGVDHPWHKTSDVDLHQVISAKDRMEDGALVEQKPQGHGLSRAALKRKKKQQKHGKAEPAPVVEAVVAPPSTKPSKAAAETKSSATANSSKLSLFDDSDNDDNAPDDDTPAPAAKKPKVVAKPSDTKPAKAAKKPPQKSKRELQKQQRDKEAAERDLALLVEEKPVLLVLPLAEREALVAQYDAALGSEIKSSSGLILRDTQLGRGQLPQAGQMLTV